MPAEQPLPAPVTLMTPEKIKFIKSLAKIDGAFNEKQLAAIKNNKFITLKDDDINAAINNIKDNNAKTNRTEDWEKLQKNTKQLNEKEIIKNALALYTQEVSIQYSHGQNAMQDMQQPNPGWLNAHKRPFFSKSPHKESEAEHLAIYDKSGKLLLAYNQDNKGNRSIHLTDLSKDSLKKAFQLANKLGWTECAVENKKFLGSNPQEALKRLRTLSDALTEHNAENKDNPIKFTWPKDKDLKTVFKKPEDLKAAQKIRDDFTKEHSNLYPKEQAQSASAPNADQDGRNRNTPTPKI